MSPLYAKRDWHVKTDGHIHMGQPVWHYGGMNEEDLKAKARQLATEYEDATERALEDRDQGFRDLKNQGLSQADIVRATGYTRETIRQALNPEIREAVRRAAAERRAAKKKET